MLRSTLVVVIVAAVAAASVFGIRSGQTEIYQAETLLALDLSSALDANNPSNLLLRSRVHASRARTSVVLEDASDRAGLGWSVEDIEDRTDVEVSELDATLTITARSNVPSRAQALATSVGDALIDHVAAEQATGREERLARINESIADVQAQLLTTRNDAERDALELEFRALVEQRAALQAAVTDRLVTLSPAQEPTSPVEPRPLRDALLAGVVAAALAAEALIAWRMLGKRRSGSTRPTD